MRATLRHIAVVILLVVYGTASQALLLRLIDVPAGPAHPQTVSKGTAHSKGERQPVWAQRRHLSMVSQLELSSGELPRQSFHENVQRFSCAVSQTVPATLLVDYFSSGCNKAPPLV